MASWNSTMTEYCELLKQRLNTGSLSQVFSKLPTDEKVSFVYDLLKCDDALPTLTYGNTKCGRKAAEFRNLGNQQFGRKKDIEALKYYTESIASAPQKSETLALGYANRSAVLLRLGRYTTALLDINRALRNNYPDSLNHKLQSRKKECLKYLQAQNSVKSMSSIMPSKLSFSPSNETSYSVTEHEIREGATRLQIPRVSFANSTIVGASQKVKINWSPEMGRHFVAVEDIKPGETLAVERSYASILLPDYYHTHCSYCYQRTEAPIPCDRCSSVVFCNNECYEQALTNFHRVECEILGFLISLKLDKMLLLALRILIVAAKQGEHLLYLYNHPIYKHPISLTRPTTTDTYNPSEYLTVHQLEDNFSKRSIANLFKRSADAAVLLHILKHSTFFAKANMEIDDVVPNDLTAVELFSGTLLLKYLLLVASNAHEISELTEMDNGREASITTESLEIGAALYPLLSLTNHSCDPNVVRHSYGDAVALRSIQAIAKGEQLFDNYGYHFAVHTRDERQTQLRTQYFFDCNCDPCKYDWPIYSELPTEEFEFLSDEVNVTEIERYTQMYKDSLSKPLNAATDDQLNNLLQYLSLLHENVRRPCKIYSACQEVVKQIMAYRANHYTLKDIVI